MITGFDVSSWQDNNNTAPQIDWVKAGQHDAKFCYIRAAYSTVIDEDFRYNWGNSKGNIPYRGAYQFYDYRYPADKQANKFIEIMAGDWGELPPVIDVEQPIAYNKVTKKYEPVDFPPPNDYQTAVKNWLAIVEKACGRKPVIYTGQNIIRYGLRVLPNSPLTKYPLWIASYQTPPVKPYYAPWTDWVFWQWGTPVVGIQMGMESKELDSNYFNGDEPALRRFAGLDALPVVELTDKQKLDWLWEKYGIPR